MISHQEAAHAADASSSFPNGPQPQGGGGPVTGKTRPPTAPPVAIASVAAALNDRTIVTVELAVPVLLATLSALQWQLVRWQDRDSTARRLAVAGAVQLADALVRSQPRLAVAVQVAFAEADVVWEPPSAAPAIAGAGR